MDELEFGICGKISIGCCSVSSLNINDPWFGFTPGSFAIFKDQSLGDCKDFELKQVNYLQITYSTSAGYQMGWTGSFIELIFYKGMNITRL